MSRFWSEKAGEKQIKNIVKQFLVKKKTAGE